MALKLEVKMINSESFFTPSEVRCNTAYFLLESFIMKQSSNESLKVGNVRINQQATKGIYSGCQKNLRGVFSKLHTVCKLTGPWCFTANRSNLSQISEKVLLSQRCISLIYPAITAMSLEDNRSSFILMNSLMQKC